MSFYHVRQGRCSKTYFWGPWDKINKKCVLILNYSIHYTYNPLRSGEDVNNRREVTATGLSCTESLHTEWRCSMAQFLLPVLLLNLLLLLLLNCSCTIVAAAEELDALWAKWCCYWLELVVAAAPAAVSILVGISFHFSCITQSESKMQC